MCYLEGYSQDQSFKQAASLFTIAANQGHPRAQYELALLLFAGNGVPREDEVQACVLLTKSAQSGNADAMLKVGVHAAALRHPREIASSARLAVVLHFVSKQNEVPPFSPVPNALQPCLSTLGVLI